MNVSVKRIPLLAALWVSMAYGNFAEFYGASTLSAGLAGQGGPLSNAAHNYYSPALLAHTNRPLLSFSTFYTQHQFKEISGVLIRPESDVYGNMNVQDDPLSTVAMHLSLPISSPLKTKLGLSLLTPMGKLMETQSGDPLLADYVMYSGRNTRTLFHMNAIGRFAPGSPYSWSVGFQGGMKVEADVSTDTSIDFQERPPSYARVITGAFPVLSPVVSVALKNRHTSFALTFQEKMESKLSFQIDGKLTDPNLTTFDLVMNSLAYYDPRILRLSWSTQRGPVELFSGFEYQFWKDYQTPVIRIESRNSVVPSQTVEELELSDIVVPKIGVYYAFSDAHSLQLGLSWRPTPLGGDFSGEGNSLDADKIIVSAGHQWTLPFFGKRASVHLAFQHHQLSTKKVNKPRQEPPQMVGYRGNEGYEVGGYAYNISGGLSISL